MEDQPSDAALWVWIMSEGASNDAFVQATCEDAFACGVRGGSTGVPYGSTTAWIDDGIEFESLHPSYALAKAWEWWESEQLEWAPKPSPVDGSRYLRLVKQTKETKR